MRLRFMLVLTLALVAVSGAACAGPGRGASSGKPLVVTSTTVLADLIRQVVGEHAEVVSIVPAGGNPFGYEPTPNDAVTISRARIVFVNGLHHEPFMTRLLSDAGVANVRQFALSAELRTLDSDIDHGDHQHIFPNPYLYLDPRNAVVYVEKIRDALVELDAGNAERYRANAATYRTELEALDGWIAQEMQQVPHERRRLLQDHASLVYYANRYDLLVLAASYEGTSEVGPSASQYATLIRQLGQYNITVLLGEVGYSPRLLEQLARDTTARLVPGLRVSTLGTTEETDSYIELMRANTRLIVDNLR